MGATHSSIALAQCWSGLADASGVKNLSYSSPGDWGPLRWKKVLGEAERGRFQTPRQGEGLLDVMFSVHEAHRVRCEVNVTTKMM